MIKEQKTEPDRERKGDRIHGIALEKLRTDIWKLALLAEDEMGLVRQLLKTVGPVLACETILFIPCGQNRKNEVVHVQWCADGHDTALDALALDWMIKQHSGQA